MDTETLADEIIELVYHGAVVHDDPWVQERCTRSSLLDLLEGFEPHHVTSEHERIIRIQAEQIDDLRDEIADLKSALEKNQEMAAA